MSTQYSEIKGRTRLADDKHLPELSLYPIDMSSFLVLTHEVFDKLGVPYEAGSSVYDPSVIVTYALARWNQYRVENDESRRGEFLAQAYWLIEHEARLGRDSSGWPIVSPHTDFHTRGRWLSALVQGCAISVLVRAFQLTQEEIFLGVACRVVRSFELDILDGGVNTPLGLDGVFFEEVAVYPASHVLAGFIFALLGLYDFVEFTNDASIQKLIQRSLASMHLLLDEFDLGFWTCTNLLNRGLSSPSHLDLQVKLLQALATYSGCSHCLDVASRWQGYQQGPGSRLRYLIANRCTGIVRTLSGLLRARLFPKSQTSPLLRVCVAVNAFPVMGGIRTVLRGIAQITASSWQLEYLTRHKGPQAEGYIIHQFGSERIAPWHFPSVWVYALDVYRKFFSLMRHGAHFDIFLPQDATFTSAFGALAAKLAGVRTVCIDHSTITLLESSIYRNERVAALAAKPWLIRLLIRFLLSFYWPSTYMMSRIAALFVDHYLIPGVVGDGVEEVCKRLKIQPSRITRFESMINIERHPVLNEDAKLHIRHENSIDVDAIVIAIICRLSPEKGIEVALEGISLAITALSPDLRKRVQVVVAGDGPLRKQIEASIQLKGLSQNCVFWGEVSGDKVISLLSISEIFLYTSTRGACYSMSVLEAMASGCAVIASTQPVSNALLLAEGRGIAVPSNDTEQTGQALLQLVKNIELAHQMGRLARAYIEERHSPNRFRRTLLRLTYWSALDEILDEK